MTWRRRAPSPPRGSCIQNKKLFKYLETALDWLDPLWFGIYSTVLLSIHGKDILSKHPGAKSVRELEENMLRYAKKTGMSGHRASPETPEESIRQTRQIALLRATTFTHNYPN